MTRHTRQRYRFSPPVSRGLAICALAILLTACAVRPYQGTDLARAPFLDRAVTLQEGEIRVSAAVPDAAETEALTGLDLYGEGIQPVWLQVENHSGAPARTALWSVDRDYYSPIEVAYMHKGKYSGGSYDTMQRWFYDNSLPRFTPAGGTTSGLVFTHLQPGTKGFNLNIFADRKSYDYTFFVPLPGFTPDFMTVDFFNLYDAGEFRDLDDSGLRHALESELGCCATDPSGELEGGPLNAVLVGSGRAVRRAMLRGNWLETEAEDASQERARRQSYRDRPPDGIFTQQRADGNEGVQLHVWATPWRYENQPVWVCTVFYLTAENDVLGVLESGLRTDSKLLDFFVRESVSADIDSARRYLLQNLWYNGSLHRVGYVRGMTAVSMDEPRTSFGDVAYFTDGLRLVVLLSEEPRALDEAEFIFDSLLQVHADRGQP